MHYLQHWRDSKLVVTFHEFECVTDRQMDKQTDGQTDGLKDTPLDRRTDGLTDGWMNRRSYGAKRAATSSAE